MRRLARLAATRAVIGAALGAAVALTSCDRFANQPKLRGFTVPFGSELAYPLVPPPGTVATDDKLDAPAAAGHAGPAAARPRALRHLLRAVPRL